MILLEQLFWTFLSTLRDVAPILLVIGFFQAVVLRQRISNWRQVAVGVGCVILGLTAFLVGLELALFPLGNAMAEQLADPRFVLGSDAENLMAAPTPWYRFYWTYIFAFAIGFSATIAEPALLAVAIKAHEVSGGTLKVWPLRAVVALGAGIGVTLGTFRIVTGIPLTYFIFAGYILIIIQTLFAPKQIVPLAYDSGGVTTSTITVPLVAAMGLGLATQIPGRSPLAEGFGMIALTVLFPMMTVMGYAQIAAWWQSRTRNKKAELDS